MPDHPDSPHTEGWHQPDEDSQNIHVPGTWYEPSDALSEEELTALRQSPPPDLPEPDIGASPTQAGGWYRPTLLTEDQGEAPVEAIIEEAPQPAPTSGLHDYIARITPTEVGTFDPSKSNLLQGIQADLGAFDDSQSGQLAGIGAEPAVEEPLPEPDPGAFDASRSGQLAGIGAEAVETFDAAKSGQIEGLSAADEGAPATTQESVDTAAPAETQMMSETNAQSMAAPLPQPKDQFTQVEEQVAVLRERYDQGEITRPQLQEELRKLMILDDAGRWWMIGVDSNKWYHYNGQDWIAEEPPRPPAPAVAASAVPTETGVQQVVAQDSSAAASQDYLAQADNMPLPARVPVQDVDATLVGQSAVTLDEHRSFEAPTQPGMQAAQEGMLDATLPSAAAPADAMGYSASGEPAISTPLSGEVGQAQQPYTRKMIGIQPDYSEAFSGYADRASLQKIGLRLAIFGTVAMLLLGLMFILGFIGFYFYVVNEYTEAIDTLGARASSFESIVIYDADGNVIGQLNDPTRGARRSITLNDVSPYLIHATVSTEDETYYENPGFSVYGIIRATIRNLQTGGGGGGASTITQQLARAIVLDPELASERTPGRKIQEIIIAAELDRKYSKSQLLEFYLNEIYYGNLAYGVEAAAQTYFGKSAKDLNLGEAAFLAGLPQAPALYDPVVKRDAAIARMSDVLRLMTEANGNGCIQMQHAPYDTQPFCVTNQDITDTYSVDIALVQARTFEPPRFEVKYPHFVNYVYQELENRYESQSIYTSGFRIYTTLVPSIQDTAQKAVQDEILITPGANNGAVIVIRPRDGAVLAMVGSADFNNEEIDGQVNVLFTPQQPGSSIKPLVYLTAIEGIDASNYWYPGTIIWDVPVCYNNGTYCPRNFTGNFLGPVSMRYALGQSLNIPAIKGLEYVTLERFNNTLQRFGIQTPGETPMQAGLPSAIGGIEIYPFEMGVAMATLANGGVRQEPFAIQRIEDRNGNIIYQAPENPPGVQVTRAEYAYLVTHILSDDSVKFVAAESIPGWQAAAKTGTTNDNRDVWTVGYTTQAALAVWVGRTDNQPMASTVLGTNTAAPIWNKVLTAALAGSQVINFNVPSGVQQYQVCSFTGAIYNANDCPGGNPVNEVAFNTQPPPQNGFLVTLSVDNFSGLLANENCPEDVVQRSFVNISDTSAIDWLNGNPNGQAWAEAHNIQLPIAPPPTESCTPGMPRPQLVISSPVPNGTVSGLTVINGTVRVPGFTGYEFQLASVATPTEFSSALGQIYITEQPNPNSVLGAVDFTPYPDGSYILRLLAHGQGNASAKVDVPIQITHGAVVPSPGGFPTSTPAPTLTPSGF